jgi:AraC family transcriptional regulator of adaptative response/methylated-DNA-[protein]-cysteine methyltransferase
MNYTIQQVETELGTMIAAASEKGICLLEFADSQRLNRKLQSLEAAFKVPIALGRNPFQNTLEREDGYSTPHNRFCTPHLNTLKGQHGCTTPNNEFCKLHLETLEGQLTEYFKGERREFDIPLDLFGTEFQKTVWLSLLQVPYGHTISYGEQAKLIERPTAVRAVANANGQNRVAIILPCHRVIGSNGALTGYGGGLWRKEKLLELEKRYLCPLIGS